MREKDARRRPDDGDSEVMPTNVAIISPPNLLRAKVGRNGPTSDDMAALEQAEQIIANLAGRYLDVAAEDVAALRQALSRLAAANAWTAEDGSPAAVEAEESPLGEIFRIAHDMKGQGGGFGFPLITFIGNQLCRFIERLDATCLSNGEIEAIALHVDALEVAVRERIADESSGPAKELLDGLTSVIRKVTG